MSTKIKIFDTTLRDGEQTPGVSLNIKEKVAIAKQLEILGVDIIEAGFSIASKGDFEAVKAVAESLKSTTVASLARAVKQDIDVAYESVKNAVSPRIHTFIATSDIHMMYKLKMTQHQVLERIKEMVEYSKKYISDIQFSAEDASRSNPLFLYKAYETAIQAGATVLNIPDTVGYSTPEEFGVFVKGIIENVRGIENVDVAVHCHNDLGLAVANTLSAMINGATQLECTINGLGERAGNAALEEIIMSINTRKDLYDYTHNIDTRQLTKTSNLVSTLSGIIVQPNKAIVGKNAFAHESGIHQHGVLAEKSTYEIMTPESVGLLQNDMVLGKHSGRHAFAEKLKEMGYTLTKEEVDETFVKFKEIADKKKQVLTKDIEALLTDKIYMVEEAFVMDSFQISTGNKLISTATLKLIKDSVEITEAATGDGPVDASFNAIERCVGFTMNLEEYKITAVTGGKDALGEVNIRVEANGSHYIGHGVSTDIIEASIKAYLNAANRVYQVMNSKE
ncbi:MAG: 2-isopropylmalate synthase [Clostridia bacterium]|nr:2-isopropylmalate synthase [Clostridia bacterium]